MEERCYPFEKYDYKNELAKMNKIHKSGRKFHVGRDSLPEKIKSLSQELAFLYIVKEDLTHHELQVFNSICKENLGKEGFERIKKIGGGIKDICNSDNSLNEKLRKMYKFLIKNYNLKNKFTVG